MIAGFSPSFVVTSNPDADPRVQHFEPLGLFGSVGAALTLALALSTPNPGHATEACGQAPSAFERVDSRAGGDDESGIGGTGLAPQPREQSPPPPPFATRGEDDSGIGGTGRAPSGSGGDESGIGGTGIFGTVLRVDRLCVNGFEIQVPETLQIESARGGDGPQSLTVGQIVFIRALRTDSKLIAQRIQIQRDLESTPWENGPALDLLSIEGFVAHGPHGPRINRFRLDFGSSANRPDARDLRPGTHVRATGRPESDGILHIAPPPRPTRPEKIDRTPVRPQESGAPRGTGDTPAVKIERPEPKSVRPADTRPERPELPDPPPRPVRPDWVRPETPAAPGHRAARCDRPRDSALVP